MVLKFTNATSFLQMHKIENKYHNIFVIFLLCDSLACGKKKYNIA